MPTSGKRPAAGRGGKLARPCLRCTVPLYLRRRASEENADSERTEKHERPSPAGRFPMKRSCGGHPGQHGATDGRAGTTLHAAESRRTPPPAVPQTAVSVPSPTTVIRRQTRDLAHGRILFPCHDVFPLFVRHVLHVAFFSSPAIFFGGILQEKETKLKTAATRRISRNEAQKIIFIKELS